MSIGRRPLRGSPLLISAAGAVVTIACGGGGGGRMPPGNLMAPPMVQLCVAATPPEAPVMVNGDPLDEQGCTSIYEGSMVTIEAELEGYQPYFEEYVTPGEPRHDIVLVPVGAVEETPIAE